eukprot:TRINITY_DN4938_c0_g1_i1.p1 TRINITY_DN4938_c0_g1~~TRINITY_DN4938_c0_g1_i1.p1  ORF type:complete len:1257 (+),score=206.44 TRINITY_DN4938_c0_g1_i1:99-3869(+)
MPQPLRRDDSTGRLTCNTGTAVSETGTVPQAAVSLGSSFDSEPQSCQVPIFALFGLFIVTTCMVAFAGFWLMYTRGKNLLDTFSGELIAQEHQNIMQMIHSFLQPFHWTLSTLRIPLLAADFRDLSNDPLRWQQDPSIRDIRQPPPAWLPGDEKLFAAWDHPIEVRLVFSSFIPVLKHWIQKVRETHGAESGGSAPSMYLGIPTDPSVNSHGNIMGLLALDGMNIWTKTDAGNPNDTVTGYTQMFPPGCYDPSGACLPMWRKSLLDLPSREFARHYSVSTRPWFTGAEAAGRQSWGQLFVRWQEQYDLGLPACMPLYRADGELKLIACQDAPLSTFKSFLRSAARQLSIAVDANSSAYIVEQSSGFLVETSTQTKDALDTANLSCRAVSTGGCRILATEHKHFGPAAQALLQHLGGSWSAVNSSVGLQIAVDGTEQYAHVGPLVDEYGLSWVLVVTLTREHIVQRLNDRLIATMLLCAGLIVVCVLIDCAVVWMISAPLRRLALAMVGAADLELGDAKPASRSVISELRSMQDTFSILIDHLKLYRGFLPQTVLIADDEPDDLAASTATIPLAMAEVTLGECSSSLSISGSSREGTHQKTAQQRSYSWLGTAGRGRKAQLLGYFRKRHATLLRAVVRSQYVCEQSWGRAAQVPWETHSGHPAARRAGHELNRFVATTLKMCGRYNAVSLQVSATSGSIVVLLSWNAHSRWPEHALQGLSCGAQLCSALADLQMDWCIGVATGPADVGNLGTAATRSPAVLGGALNDAVALCSLAFSLRSHLLMNAATAEVVRGDVRCRIVDCVAFLHSGGRAVSNVFRPCGAEDPVPEAADPDYNEAWSALMQGGSSQAERLFASYLAVYPQDVDARRMHQIAELRAQQGISTEYCRAQQECWQDWAGHAAAAASSAVPPEKCRSKGYHCGPGDLISPQLQQQDGEGMSNEEDAVRRHLQAAVIDGDPERRRAKEIRDHHGRRWFLSGRRLGSKSSEVWLGMGESGSMAAIKCHVLAPAQVNEKSATPDGSNPLVAGARRRESPAFDDLVVEVALLAEVRHDNIVHYISASVSPGWLYIVMEYVSGGSLEAMLKQFARKLPAASVRRNARGITDGLRFLHGRSIFCHCLTPATILVSIEGQCKLSGFGAVAKLEAAVQHGGKTHHVDRFYSAPEVAAGGLVTAASDIWSFGVTYLELLTGKLPWNPADLEDADAFWSRLASEQPPLPLLPTDRDHHAVAFAQSCLAIRPEERKSARELMNHPYLLG